MKCSTIAGFWNFYHGVKNSNSVEVRVMANTEARDIRSITERNLEGIRKLCDVDLTGHSRTAVRQLILGAKAAVPDRDCWRIECLRGFLNMWYQMNARLDDTSQIDSMIDSLCST